jgi:hypothetical protein
MSHLQKARPHAVPVHLDQSEHILADPATAVEGAPSGSSVRVCMSRLAEPSQMPIAESDALGCLIMWVFCERLGQPS